MNLSLNELSALCKKAIRGAGYSWGTAEEGAECARWLASFGLFDGDDLADLLDAGPSKFPEKLSTLDLKKQPIGSSILLPITLGAYYRDLGTKMCQSDVTFTRVHSSIFLLPFVAQTARANACSLALLIGDVTITTDGQHVEITGGPIPMDRTMDVKIVRGQTKPAHSSVQSRCMLRPSALRRLEAFAHRTYAPATEASRLLGAGAGTTDND